jgi:hypothetical protein
MKLNLNVSMNAEGEAPGLLLYQSYWEKFYNLGQTCYMTNIEFGERWFNDPEVQALIKEIIPHNKTISKVSSSNGLDHIIALETNNRDTLILVTNYSDRKSSKISWLESTLDNLKPTILNFKIISSDKEIVSKFTSKARLLFKETDKKDKVFVLISTPGGLEMRSLGMAGTEFIPDNYNAHVEQSYKYIVNELNKESPNGRIVLLNGPPGTGKTFCLRAMLKDVPNSTFLIIPSNMVDAISDPSFMTFFYNNKNQLDGPIVLVIEDADRCLASRASDNISAISTLLNMTDGIAGHLLDIRVVATTNASMDEIDSAVTRPGRLLKHVQINKLTPDECSKIWYRLCGEKKEFPYSKTLAELYCESQGEVRPMESKKKSMGFGS